MATIAHLALVSESASVALPEVTRVSAALQQQVTRDLTQFWDIQGTVDAFATLEDIPPGYWPVIVKDDIGQDAAGVHCDDTGQPMALITSDLDWSVTASHEALEMLVDPFGNARIAGQSVKADQGRVEYLLEISDPVSGKWYQINGVKVSDFCTPRYFDPIQSPGVKYSFMGSLTGPRQILFGGYLTWFEPVSAEWWQQSWFAGDQPALQNLGPIQKSTCGMRPAIDRLSERHRASVGGKRAKVETPEADRATQAVAASSRAKAERWRAHIAKLIGNR
jgi:hypothetical protein